MRATHYLSGEGYSDFYSIFWNTEPKERTLSQNQQIRLRYYKEPVEFSVVFWSLRFLVIIGALVFVLIMKFFLLKGNVTKLYNIFLLSIDVITSLPSMGATYYQIAEQLGNYSVAFYNSTSPTVNASLMNEFLSFSELYRSSFHKVLMLMINTPVLANISHQFVSSGCDLFNSSYTPCDSQIIKSQMSTGVLGSIAKLKTDALEATAFISMLNDKNRPNYEQDLSKVKDLFLKLYDSLLMLAP